MMAIFTFIGIIIAPAFTLGCVLFYFGHPILGVFAIILSLFFHKSPINWSEFFKLFNK